jgi:hypothetical protein
MAARTSPVDKFFSFFTMTSPPERPASSARSTPSTGSMSEGAGPLVFTTDKIEHVLIELRGRVIDNLSRDPSCPLKLRVRFMHPKDPRLEEVRSVFGESIGKVVSNKDGSQVHTSMLAFDEEDEGHFDAFLRGEAPLPLTDDHIVDLLVRRDEDGYFLGSAVRRSHPEVNLSEVFV